jgi:hypothetical protein
VLAQQIRDRRTQLRLLQDPGDLLDRKALPLHDKTSVLVDSILSQNSLRRWSGFIRAGHRRDELPIGPRKATEWPSRS